MRNTKSYGVVSGWQEHQMLVHAEHTRQREAKIHKIKRKDKHNAED